MTKSTSSCFTPAPLFFWLSCTGMPDSSGEKADELVSKAHRMYLLCENVLIIDRDLTAGLLPAGAEGNRPLYTPTLPYTNTLG